MEAEVNNELEKEQRPRKVLIIGNKNEFLVRSVINDLRWRHFEIEEVEPTVTEISRADESIKIYIIFIERIADVQNLLVYLKDVIFDKKLSVCVVCNHLDALELENYVTKDEIAAVFERPVNIKEIGSAIDEIFQKSSTAETRRSILIVDDDPTFLHKTQQLFRDTYKVYMANSAASALMVLSKHTVDLILLDYEMPIVGGPQAYEMIKAEPSVADTPIMFLTGKTDMQSVKKAISLKPAHYLTKTLPASELLATISYFFVHHSLPGREDG